MGRDGNLPAIFGRIHPITHTPHWAVFISGALIIVMAIALPIEDVAASADIMFLLLFMMVCYSLITLRERRPDLDRQFMVPFFPYLPWLGIILCLLLSLRQRERRAAEERPILLEEVVAVKEYSVC